MSFRPALDPSSVDVTLAIGGKTTTLSSAALSFYGGQPLFFRAQSNGDLLSIVIDDIRSPTTSNFVRRLPPASSVDVTFIFNGAIVNHWPAVVLNYPGIEGLTFSATVDPTLQNVLHFAVTDATPTASTTPKDGVVSFVLVQPAPGADFQIHWIKTDNIVVGNANALEGSVVLRAEPPVATGGVTGPMGFSTP